MILVVVAASAAIFAVANNSFLNWSSGFSSIFGTSSSQIAQKVVVEFVTFNETGSSLGANIYVRNDGQSLASISSVYITNVTSGNTFVSSDPISTPSIPAGSFAIIPAKFTPDEGCTYSFTIATSLGNTVTVNAKA
jgi:hypothetical protein